MDVNNMDGFGGIGAPVKLYVLGFPTLSNFYLDFI